MKIIPLTKGRYACVDDDVYPMLSQWRWTSSGRGYALLHGPIYMHRVVVALQNLDSCDEVDHKNGCGFDNRLQNLRPATCSQNRMNKQSAGVSWSAERIKWQACIRKDGRTLHLGRFAKKADAERVVAKAKIKHFGDYAYDPLLRRPLFGWCIECDARLPGSTEQAAEVSTLLNDAIRPVALNNKSGTTGVSLLRNGRYLARLQSGGKVRLNKEYTTIEDAVAARREAERQWK